MESEGENQYNGLTQMTEALPPQERLAITEQELKRLTEQREAQMEQTERLFRGLRYLFWALWVMTMLWILADHFWK